VGDGVVVRTASVWGARAQVLRLRCGFGCVGRIATNDLNKNQESFNSFTNLSASTSQENAQCVLWYVMLNVHEMQKLRCIL
jgi:hypothetical protein